MDNLISIILPTRNEELNIKHMLTKGLHDAAIMHSPTYKYEAIVVDDSDDHTAMIAKAFGARVIKGKRQGLGQAILDGIAAAQGGIIVVLDADGSHNPHAIPGMIRPILNEGADFVVGSRYVSGGGSIGWSLKRRVISRFASLLALPVTSIKDATSGFFAFKKEILNGVTLKPSSWKIMLEVLLKAEPANVRELPIQFEERHAGSSKFNRKQMVAYIKHLVLLAMHRYRKFLKFCIVGGCGAVICFGLTFLLTEVAGLWYMLSLLIAVAVATIWNFSLNFMWTFANKRDPEAADYDWASFYKGNPIQKWWKHSIANIVWRWIPDASELLNIGCGSSPIAMRYPKSVNIDTNENKLYFLKAKLPELIVGVMSAEELQYGDNSFDHVLCIEVLEHLNNPEKTISEISRVLRPGGNAVLATPDYNRPLWHVAEKFTPAGEQHVFHFSRRSLEEACRKQGLIPVKHKYVAGCDLVEMFTKEHKTKHSDTEIHKGKAPLLKIGAKIASRIINPTMSKATIAITYKCNHKYKLCVYEANRRVNGVSND